MKQLVNRTFATLFLIAILALTAEAGVLQGVIIDKQTREPLMGATVRIVGTSFGAVADMEGNYQLPDLKNGTYQVEVKYIGNRDIIQQNVVIKASQPLILNFEMEADALLLSEVAVVARKNLEGEQALMQERQLATLAIESMGAKEMSLKGASTVQDGVKKISGISVAGAGQLIVRGLGDRYSTTTLNGLPIASPNPDHKLIPLDLFPASTVQNITVNKVYRADAFADYSGAHIDISTKENTGNDFFSVGLATGGAFNTLGRDFYRSDRQGGLLRTGNLQEKEKLLNMSRTEFRTYMQSNDPFGTDFSVRRTTSLPELSANIGGGKSWRFNNGNRLSLLASAGMSNEYQRLDNAYITTLTAQGTHLDTFTYDSFATTLKLAALSTVGYSFGKADHINYTLFYARNAVDDYRRRVGVDPDGNNLVSSNSAYRSYALLNNQLLGHHELSNRWEVNWSASYGTTRSDEPDRRQVIFFRERAGEEEPLNLFKLNQTTNRYFSELTEDEVVGELRTTYRFGEKSLARLGGIYRNKGRDFESVNFYYDINALDPAVSSIYETNNYLNQANIANGTILVNVDAQPRNNYYANTAVWAAFTEWEFEPLSSLFVNAGLRYEQADQWVRYWTDGGKEVTTTLNQGDLFPALNLKYTLNSANSLRLSLSRTVTRPSFIEMAPFLYQQSYGSAYTRGNDLLQNAYNYNVDLRYDLFSQADSRDMFSITGYFKKLDAPIEQTQESSGGTVVHSFRNAEGGIATGVEIEFRKELIKQLRLGFNGSYMFTNVVLPEGGVYTETKRALQGASPFLINADLNYTPRFRDRSELLLTLVYQVHGERIQTVGIYELGDVKQQALHTMDFIGGYSCNQHLSFSLKVKDLLNSTFRFRQDVPQTGERITVETYRPGTRAEVGVTYKF